MRDASLARASWVPPFALYHCEERGEPPALAHCMGATFRRMLSAGHRRDKLVVSTSGRQS